MLSTLLLLLAMHATYSTALRPRGVILAMMGASDEAEEETREPNEEILKTPDDGKKNTLRVRPDSDLILTAEPSRVPATVVLDCSLSVSSV